MGLDYGLQQRWRYLRTTNFDMNSKSNQINDIIVVNNELFY